jgi:hypothetical protein
MAPMFVRAPEDGTMLRIDLHSTERPCERYSARGEGNGDFWYVSLELGAPDIGDYKIGTDIDEEAPRDQRRLATVRLFEVRGWRRQRVYEAPEGTVTLDSAPADFGAWREGGAKSAGLVEAMFSLTPRRQLECMGEATASSMERSCRCIDEQEKVTTCVPNGGENCCVGPPPYLQWIGKFEALRCPALCAGADSGLFAQFCQEPP